MLHLLHGAGRHKTPDHTAELTAKLAHRDTVIRRQNAELLRAHERNASLTQLNRQLTRELRNARAELNQADTIRPAPICVTAVRVPAGRLHIADIPQLAAIAR